MSNSITITAKWLIQQGACEEQVQKFSKQFGESVNLTKKLAEYAQDYDIFWLAQKMMTEQEYFDWYATCRAYEREHIHNCTCGFNPDGFNPDQVTIEKCVAATNESIKLIREQHYFMLLKTLRAKKEKRGKYGTDGN